MAAGHEAGAYNALRILPLQLGILPLHPRGLTQRRSAVAIQKKKREGKKTIPVSQATRTRSGAKKHKSDGKQPPHVAETTSEPVVQGS